jgi:16S rRNA (adenine1518-N6/adenine1519-N6)-dimethyltransferase
LITAKKRFGQNFLTDTKKADKLIEAMNIEADDVVLEIGPGKGVLTERLLRTGAEIIAVEIDRELIPFLRERFGANQRFILIEDDIINLNPSRFASSGLKVMGNLPYNISGAVVEWLIEYHAQIGLAVVTLQREVADRLRANPGNRNYGSLSVLAQSFYDIEKLFDIPPGCFSPKPKVTSSALRFRPCRSLDIKIDYIYFRDFVRSCFSQKRKKLINSLAAASGIAKNEIDERLLSMGLRSNVRAEELTLNQYYRLYDLWHE